MIDDSGTESGEEVNQKILVQVQGALANLESALPALDPSRRSSVAELLTKLQTSLKLSAAEGGKPMPPPRKYSNKKPGRHDRHTVGVSSEELQDARRWLEENGFTTSDAPPAAEIAKPAASACPTPRSYISESFSSKTFRPVKFVPPPPKRTHYAEDFIPEPAKQSLHTESFACPPLQHGVVESLPGKRRKVQSTSNPDSTDSSSTGDVSDDQGRSVSSAQRLLQIASNDLVQHGRKFRHGKRVKLKRAVGPSNDVATEEHSSADECHPQQPTNGGPVCCAVGGGVPPFEPKTASDKKYLALLRQTRDEETVAAAYPNPLHGKLQGNWSNRFGRIKTTFERSAAPTLEVPRNKTNGAKTFWNDICKCPSENSIPYKAKKITSFKPVWSGENGFSHAVKSAFKPVLAAPKPGPPPPPPDPFVSVQKPAYPKHAMPLYNSSVTTAHRPFIYSDKPSPSEDTCKDHQWNVTVASPCSASDLTCSLSASPSTDLDVPLQPTAISRVMGSPQTASIVKGKTQHHRANNNKPHGHQQQPEQPRMPNNRPLYPPTLQTAAAAAVAPPSPVYVPLATASSFYSPPAHGAAAIQAPRPPVRSRSPRLVTQQRSPTSSPVQMPSVLQKSESWHQMIMGQSKAAARSAAGALQVPVARPVAPYEGYLAKEQIAHKQSMVRQRLRTAVGSPVKPPQQRSSPRLVKLNDDIDKVDDTFESLFKESTKSGK